MDRTFPSSSQSSKDNDNASSEDKVVNLSNQAIEKALAFEWIKAIDLNKQIIKLEPENIDCLNRLAKAYFEVGRYQQAKKLYQQVLAIDPYNTIAQKNLKKAASFKKNANEQLDTLEHTKPVMAISPSLFLEESGITKAVSLIKVAEPQKLSKLSSGIMVNLVAKNRGVSITDQDSRYLGVLPDDTGHLLLRLMRGGNKYQALIKSVKHNGLTILIREVFRSKKFKNQPSFLDSSSVATYPSDNISLSYDESSEEPSDPDTEDTVV